MTLRIILQRIVMLGEKRRSISALLAIVHVPVGVLTAEPPLAQANRGLNGTS